MEMERKLYCGWFRDQRDALMGFGIRNLPWVMTYESELDSAINLRYYIFKLKNH